MAAQPEPWAASAFTDDAGLRTSADELAEAATRAVEQSWRNAGQPENANVVLEQPTDTPIAARAQLELSPDSAAVTRVAAQRMVALKGKIHRVDPTFVSTLTV